MILVRSVIEDPFSFGLTCHEFRAEVPAAEVPGAA